MTGPINCKGASNSIRMKGSLDRVSTDSLLERVIEKTRNGPGENMPWHFHASTETLIQVRVSHLVKLTGILLLAVVIFSVVFYSRIQQLERERDTIFKEFENVQMQVQLLLQRMDDVVNIAIPPKSQRQSLRDRDISVRHDSNDGMLTASGQENTKKLVKRSASPGRNEGRGNSEGNFIHNQTASLFVPSTNEWTSSRRTKSKQGKNIKKIPGRKLLKRLIREEMKKFQDPTILEMKTFYYQLRNIFSSNLSPISNVTAQNSHTFSNAHSACGCDKSRAVYLQIDGSSVNIKKARQLIGPWYFPDVGEEIGFNDLWYNNIALDTNGTSIIFKEGGLYLISAQVFYQLQHFHGSKPPPMGYRVHLKKYGNDTHGFRRPLTIAECVPSFPSTVYQTCFTQVAWYFGERDEVFLEHFTDSRPMIEALRSGQTYLSILKL